MLQFYKFEAVCATHGLPWQLISNKIGPPHLSDISEKQSNSWRPFELESSLRYHTKCIKQNTLFILIIFYFSGRFCPHKIFYKILIASDETSSQQKLLILVHTLDLVLGNSHTKFAVKSFIHLKIMMSQVQKLCRKW